MSLRYVILGNGIAGQSCAEELRKMDADASITIVAAEPHPLYSRVALPRYLRGQIDEPSVFLRNVGATEAVGIELLASTRAVAIDPSDREVHTDRAGYIPYDALLVATGGRPKLPPWSGAVSGTNILPFQTIDDARLLIARSGDAKDVLVLGGGFIGYELAEAINHQGGKSVTWAMRGRRFLQGVLDKDAGVLCGLLAEEAGVELLAETVVDSIAGTADGCDVRFAEGTSRHFDLVAYGVGLDYATEVLGGTPLAARRGVTTDSCLQTALPGVFAAGDIAIFFDKVLGRANQMGSWDSAQAQGRAVAANMAGGRSEFHSVPTYTTTLFGSAIAVLGHVDRDDETVESEHRFCLSSKLYQRLSFRDGSLVGAVVIGPPKGRKKLLDLIRTGIPCRDTAFSHLPS